MQPGVAAYKSTVGTKNERAIVTVASARFSGSSCTRRE
jgi:hypothetical protein